MNFTEEHKQAFRDITAGNYLFHFNNDGKEKYLTTGNGLKATNWILDKEKYPEIFIVIKEALELREQIDLKEKELFFDDILFKEGYVL